MNYKTAGKWFVSTGSFRCPDSIIEYKLFGELLNAFNLIFFSRVKVLLLVQYGTKNSMRSVGLKLIIQYEANPSLYFV